MAGSDVIRIKVVGIGGAGNNVVSRMMLSGVSGIEYVNINTDKPTLQVSGADVRVQIGEKLTHGQGAGSNPEVGRMAAEESRNSIAKVFEETDAVFLSAGMGGGTGTGAAPVVAEIARESGVLTIAVVTKPFKFEGAVKMKRAEAGIKELLNKVDTLFVIPNENLKKVSEQKITFANAFEIADGVLNKAVSGIAEILRHTGFINLDFADLKTIMRKSGLAHLGVGEASGKSKVEEASRDAIYSELTETSVNGARRVVINVTGSMDLSMEDVENVVGRVQKAAHPDANIIFGVDFDERLIDAMRVIVIATDFETEEERAEKEAKAAAQKKAEEPVSPPKPQSAEDEDWDILLKMFDKK
ncbi:MAG: cell division protein FtsZ [Papillibacter sp.]|nr:cell division protein FtsZ [Papillibacter sp.]